jgi:secreted PhoX family phosphatase
MNRAHWIVLPLLAACDWLPGGGGHGHGDSGDEDVDAPSITFERIGVPTSDADKREIIASPTTRLSGAEVSTDYHTIVRTGDSFKSGIFGKMYDAYGNPVLAEDGSELVSSDEDFSSFLWAGSRLWMVTHFETIPAGMYVTELTQDTKTGLVTAVDTWPIDFSSVGGLWTPCAGSVTPWGTHLGSEEYPADARAFESATTTSEVDASSLAMARYWGLDPYTDSDKDGEPDLDIGDLRDVYNPYAYGYATEVTLDSGGGAAVAKHYAMGRRALELAKVMPDNRTVYLTDDGTNVGLWMFVADTAGDLDAGTLYAMKWLQTSDEGPGSADIEWIDVGHATSSDIETAIDSGLTFSDLFAVGDPIVDAKGVKTGECEKGFTPINTEVGFECLMVQKGMDVIASRLEARRYAAYVGATTELRKEEGMAYDPIHNSLFVAMSEVARGMEDFAKTGSYSTSYDLGGPNDIRLPYNLCGAVYELALAPSSTIDSDYVAEAWWGLVEGIPTTYPEDSEYASNTCSVNGISNPDNLGFLPEYDTLIIGEDATEGHQNDAMWAYDMATGDLTRILTTPYGAETTGVYWYDDIGGWSYLRATVQHPYGESDEDKLVDPADARAYVGYFGPLPAAP